jgi:two-component system chemotaxis sensor kinase CheA
VLRALTNNIGELQVVRDQLLLSERIDRDGEYGKAISHLDRISNELKSLVHRLFMQPIGSIWMRLPRVARDIATSQGKQVRLQMDGEDVRVDRDILEAIKDPLVHLVRNSIDHGIESPDERRAAGKSIEGKISLRAFRAAEQVTIEVTDDGAGVDLQRVCARALDMSLITPSQAAGMEDQELARLVFVPGLSTAQRVTQLSGRGVGMDIVRTNTERIGGTVVLETHRGQGLKVKINLPLSESADPILWPQ